MRIQRSPNASGGTDLMRAERHRAIAPRRNQTDPRPSPNRSKHSSGTNEPESSPGSDGPCEQLSELGRGRGQATGCGYRLRTNPLPEPVAPTDRHTERDLLRWDPSPGPHFGARSASGERTHLASIGHRRTGARESMRMYESHSGVDGFPGRRPCPFSGRPGSWLAAFVSVPGSPRTSRRKAGTLS